MNPGHNVFVGISLQNKTLNGKRVSEFLMTAKREFHARELLFLIADEIDLINRRVYVGDNEILLRKKVEVSSQLLENTIRESLSNCAVRDIHTSFCRWADILTPQITRLSIEIEYLFINNLQFRSDIRAIAAGYSAKRPKRATESEETYLCQYILAEIPVIMRGVDIKGRKFRSMIYPVPKRFALDGVVDNIFNGHYGTLPLPTERCAIVKV
jgi:tRNA-dependent cyclodipeptide synthase